MIYESEFRMVPYLGDAERIRVICESTGFFRADETDVAVELVEEALAQGSEKSGYHFIFVQKEGVTAGFVCYGPTPCTIGTWDLYWIVVHNDFRGMGLGMKLMEETENALRQSNARKLYIETSSTEKYIPTRRFYDKAQYTEEARLKDFYTPGDDKVIFSKVF